MRQSHLFTRAAKEIPRDEVSVNAGLLIRARMVDKLAAGIYSYLPLGLQVLGKIERIIREEMNGVGGQEVLMPAIHPREYWDTTGRWDSVDVLFKLTGTGDKEFALGATHEEVVTPLAKQFISSYKNLPFSVYQIQTKFRNEPRAKSGLLRGREFRMKDMYSFHASESDLDIYYDRVKDAYMKIYERCGIGELTFLTFASGGAFSKYSHEFQMTTEYGEDVVYLCEKCSVAVNKEILADQPSCPSCGNKNLSEKKAIEVGNIFKLKTRFSDAFDLSYTDETGKKQPVVMGCFGIGSSRLMGAIVEAHHDGRGIIWPREVAPFAVHVVSLCKRPDDIAKAESLYQDLTNAGMDVLFDDRADASAGEKFAEADLIGIPVRMVVSEKTLAQDSVEVRRRTDEKASLIPFKNAAAEAGK